MRSLWFKRSLGFFFFCRRYSFSGVNAKLEIWRDTLESKGFQLVGIKLSTQNVSVVKVGEWMVKLDGPEILKSESFWYLGSIIHRGGEIEEDVNHKIRA